MVYQAGKRRSTPRAARNWGRRGSHVGDSAHGNASFGGSSHHSSSSHGSSGGSSYGYNSSYAKVGISRSEWSHMNSAARAAVAKQAKAGTLRKAGSGGSSSSKPSSSKTPSSSARTLTVVNRQGEPIREYTAVTDRFTVKDQASALVHGVTTPGTYERQTLYRKNTQQYYPSFSTGKKVSRSRELSGSFSHSPLLSTQIENIAGIQPKVETSVLERKEPGLFGAGRVVKQTTVTPMTKAQAQLLTASHNNFIGSSEPMTVSFVKKKPLPSRLDQKIAPKVEGTFTGLVALEAGKLGTKLVNWAEPRLAASKARSAAQGAVLLADNRYATTSFLDVKPWKQERYSEVAGFGGFLQGAGETTFKQPSKIVAGGAIAAGFTLLTSGAASGAAAITGEGLFANIGRQTLVRTSKLATVSGYAATGFYALDVGTRFNKMNSSTEKGRVLGGEVPAIAGMIAGGAVVGEGINVFKRGRVASVSRGVIGQPLTEKSVLNLNQFSKGDGEVFVTGRELQGVRVEEGAVSDKFGIRGLKEQRPIFSKEQTYSLGDAPQTSDYYAAVGRGRGGLKTDSGEVVSRSFDVSRVVTGRVAERSASPRFSSYNYPELNSDQTGIKATFSGNAELRFKPIKAGVVRSNTGHSLSPDEPFFRNLQSDLSFNRMARAVKITEFNPKNAPYSIFRVGEGKSSFGVSEGKSYRSPEFSLFNGETIVSHARSKGGNLGGFAKKGAKLPGYDFSVGGQKARLLYDTWEPKLKESSGKSGVGGPFIVEGIKFEGLGEDNNVGFGRAFDDFSVMNPLSKKSSFKGAFGIGSVFGKRVSAVTSNSLVVGKRQRVGSTNSLLSDSMLGADVVMKQDEITLPDDEVRSSDAFGGGVVVRSDYVSPDIPPPTELFGGGFALPFGGGRQGRGRRRGGKVRFKTSYNPSIMAEVFNIHGSKKRGRAAARTGIGVRPIL